MMNDEQVLKLCKNILILKENLKCPICLEIMQETVELECGHRLCENCYVIHKKCYTNKETKKCPVCNALITRRSQCYKDEFANQLGCFIAQLCNRIETYKGCTIEELVHNNKQHTKIITKSMKVLIKPLQLIEQIKNKGNTSLDAGTSQESIFDKLVNTNDELRLNRKGTKIKYTKRRKKEEEENDNYKILEFDNISTKESVLQWLNDTRNQFDRLTQSQIPNTPIDNFFIDLTSISQVNVKKPKPLTINVVKKRAKSLNLDLNTSKKDKSCLSDLDIIDNYNIEEINSEELVTKAEENVYIHMIEDDILDKIDQEFETNHKNDKKTDQINTQQSSTHSGWERIEKMKSFKKKRKSPKKLNITLQHTQNTSISNLSDSSFDISTKTNKKRRTSKNNSLIDNDPVSVNKLDDSKILNTSRISTNSKNIENLDISNHEKTKQNISHDSPQSSSSKNSKKKLLTSFQKSALKDNDSVGVTELEESKNMNTSRISTNSKNNENLDISNHNKTKQNISHDSPQSSSSRKSKKQLLTTSFQKSANKDSVAVTNLEDSKNMNTSRLSTNSKNNENLDISNHNKTVQNTSLDSPQSTSSRKSKRQLLTSFQKSANKDNDPEAESKVLNVSRISTNSKNNENLGVSNHNKTVQNISQDSFHSNEKKTPQSTSSRKSKRQLLASFQKSAKKKSLIANLDSSIDDVIMNPVDQTSVSGNNEEIEKEPEEKDKLQDVNKNNNQHNSKTKITKSQILDIVEVPKINKNNDNNGTLSTVNILSNIVIQTNKDEEDPYLLPTQKINESNEGFDQNITDFNDYFHEFQTFDELIEKLRDKIESCVNIVKNESVVTLNHLNIMKNYLEELNRFKISKNDVQTQTNNNSCDSYVQTENPKYVSKETQTTKETHSTKETQTSNEIIQSTREKSQITKSNTQRESENDPFKGTLDLINFETQDMENQYLQKQQELLLQKQQENPLNESRINVTQKRTLSNDSDSDSEVNVPKKRCNRFIRDDLSVVFDASESVKTQGMGLSLDTDDDNNEEYLNQIMKKYKTGEAMSSPTSSKSSKPTENINDDCDNIAAVVSENVKKLTKQNENKTKLDHDTTLKKNDNRNKGYSEFSDIIGKTESPEPLPKKSKKDVKKVENNENMCMELDDSLNELDLESIFEKELTPKNCRDSNNDDLFSDEDIVETTPQKDNRTRNNGSSNFSLTKNPTPLENFDLDFIPLAPPPGFEDTQNTSVGETTVIHVEKNIKKNNENVVSLYQKIAAHSTPNKNNIGPESLGFSPIIEEISQRSNLMERITNSDNTTILSQNIETTPKKHNILTSIPMQKSILNYVKSPKPKQKPCIACTRLSKDQSQSISLLVNKNLATYSSKFNNSVTHMIVAVDEQRKIKDYTMKFVSAVASGIWVISFEWIQDCLKNNSILPEEPYEVVDESGELGPKISRLTRLKNPLFKNFKFYCAPPFYSTTMEDVADVIDKLGGTTVRKLENLPSDDGKICLIVIEGRETQDFYVYERWFEKYKIVTVDIEWLSKSVGRYKVLSIRPYIIWCPEDAIDRLGYPASLIYREESL